MPQVSLTSASSTAPASWAATRERGTLMLMRLTFLGLRWVARPLMAPIVRLPTLYFFAFGRRARSASIDYLARIAAAVPASGLQPNRRHAWRHFKAFETAILDKLDAWLGRLRYEDVVFEGDAALRSNGGALIIGSHLGNLEVCRALAQVGGRAKLNVLVHTVHADYFNRILKMAGATEVELIQVTQLDVATALKLKSRIERGEWVVVTGDRVPVTGTRTVDVEFLGGTAALPIGPYVLAALLDCPVHLLFCLRRMDRHHVYVEPFAERIQWSRTEREATIAGHAQRFARRLEHYLKLEPLQWFNFYPFWR